MTARSLPNSKEKEPGTTPLEISSGLLAHFLPDCQRWPDTPEGVALALLQVISKFNPTAATTQQEILDLFAECLRAACGERLGRNSETLN